MARNKDYEYKKLSSSIEEENLDDEGMKPQTMPHWTPDSLYLQLRISDEITGTTHRTGRGTRIQSFGG